LKRPVVVGRADGGPPGRAPGAVVGRAGAVAGLRKSILPSTFGPRGPSSSVGAAEWAELVKFIVRPGRSASPMRASGRRGAKFPDDRFLTGALSRNSPGGIPP
jgi:hypothetical protein